MVLCGDINIAHKEIDLKNWKGNLNHSGFLPEERAWMTTLFEQYGWVDVFRRLDPRPDRYTWWSQRGQARAKTLVGALIIKLRRLDLPNVLERPTYTLLKNFLIMPLLG